VDEIIGIRFVVNINIIFSGLRVNMYLSTVRFVCIMCI